MSINAGRVAEARIGSRTMDPQDLLESLEDACLFLDRDWQVIYLNAAAEAYYGRERACLLGRSLLKEFPVIVGSPGQIEIDKVLQGGPRGRFETVSMLTGSPVEFDIQPHADGALVFIRDARIRWALEEELRRRDAQLRLAEESAGVGVWEIDLRTDMVRGTPQYFRIMGLDPTTDAVPMAIIRDLRVEGDRERVVDDYAKAVHTLGGICETEYRIRRPSGDVRWVFGRGRILRDEHGAVHRYSGVDIDITDRKATEQALAESENRLRMAVDAAQLGIWDWNIVTNEITWSKRAKEIAGVAAEEKMSFHQVRNTTHPEDLPRTHEAARRALDPKIRSSEPYEYRIVRPDGSVRWVAAHGDVRFATINGVERAIRYTGTLQDITEKKMADEHRQLMHLELQHRVSNTLTLVAAIANQTFTDSDPALRQAFARRLGALGQAHDILSRDRWRIADCRDVVEYAVSPFRINDESFTILGAPCRLDSRRAVALALCLNELATNAAKYGALSVREGRVNITWDAEPAAERKMLVFRWIESGGPPVKPPTRSGFGTRLISDSLAADFDGEAKVDYGPEGVVFTLRAPWPDPPGPKA